MAHVAGVNVNKSSKTVAGKTAQCVSVHVKGQGANNDGTWCVIDAGVLAYVETGGTVVELTKFATDVSEDGRYLVIHVCKGTDHRHRVTYKDLGEPYGIYAGNPARLLRHRFPPHVVKWLLGLQWWSWSSRPGRHCLPGPAPPPERRRRASRPGRWSTTGPCRWRSGG